MCEHEVSTRRVHFHLLVCVLRMPRLLSCALWAAAPHWELSLNPLQEQQMLLYAKSSL